MKIFLSLLTVCISLCGQAMTLQREAEFDLGADLRWNRSTRIAGSTLIPTVDGLAYGVICQGSTIEPRASFVAADANGRIRKTTADIFYALATPVGVLPSVGGNVWLIAEGRSGAIWLDLYNQQGHIIKSSLRLTGSEAPRRVLAATGEEVVFYGSTQVHFELLTGSRFTPSVNIARPGLAGPTPDLAEKIAVPVLAEDGDLIMVNRRSGDLLIFDPRRKTSALVNMGPPVHIAGATSDAGYLYLLTQQDASSPAAIILKVDRQGVVNATYTCPLNQPHNKLRLIGVKGNALYLADARGRGGRFSIPTSSR